MEIKATKKEMLEIIKALNVYYQMYKRDETSVLLSRLIDDFKKEDRGWRYQ